MRTSFVKNGLVMVVILLFIGVAVQPSIATVQPKKIDVEPDIEGLVAELRVVINEILQKYGYNPMVAYLCNNILGIIDGFIMRIVCILVIIIFIPFAALVILLRGIFGEIVNPLLGMVGWIALWLDRECTDYKISKSIQPLRTISTLTGLDECPCMQE